MSVRTRIARNAFNAGELSPRMLGLVEHAAFAAGAKAMLGWLPLLQGPAAVAPGTVFVAKAAGPCRLIPFEYDVEASYAIEASAAKFRFYTDNARIETSPGTPFELAAPWTLDQLGAIDWQPSMDVLYLVHAEVKPRELRRITPTSFAFADLDIRNGPFDDGNSDEAMTVSASGDSGSVELTASAGMFDADDVGRLLLLEAKDFGGTPAWEVGIEVSSGYFKVSDAKLYKALTSGRTGTVQPVHTEGVAYDGMLDGTDVNDNGPYGVLWEYWHDRFGLVEITAVAGDTSATATVLRRLPTGYDDPNFRWSWGAFSDRSGWPEAVTLWGERIVFGWRDRLLGSAVGGYGRGMADFSERDDSGDFQRDLSFSYRLQSPNRIRWLVARKTLNVGAANAEHLVEMVLVQNGIPGPPVLQSDISGERGSLKVKPVRAAKRLLYVQAAGTKLLDFGEDDAPDGEPDLTLISEHLGTIGLREIAWVQEPEGQLWAVLADGQLAVMTYSPTQRVHGWARRELGGGLKARSICAIRDPSGTRDQLWIAAETPGAEWWILRMAPLRAIGDPLADAYYVDAGLTYSGAATDTGGGAGHLAGMTVSVLADGRLHPDIEIGEDGSWQLEFAASKVHLGLSYPSVLTVLPPAFNAGRGTAQGQIRKIPKLVLRLIEAGGIEAEVQGLKPRPIETRGISVPFDQPTPLFTGDFPIEPGGDFDRTGEITVRRTQPLPAMLLSLIAECEVTE